MSTIVKVWCICDWSFNFLCKKAVVYLKITLQHIHLYMTHYHTHCKILQLPVSLHHTKSMFSHELTCITIRWKKLKLDCNLRHKSLKQKQLFLNFCENVLHSLFSRLFSLKCGPLLPDVEPRVFWSTEATIISKSSLGKGEITQVFQDLWRVL